MDRVRIAIHIALNSEEPTVAFARDALLTLMPPLNGRWLRRLGQRHKKNSFTLVQREAFNQMIVLAELVHRAEISAMWEKEMRRRARRFSA